MKKRTFTLDGERIRVAPGTTIREAAERQGIFIPTFCHMKEAEQENSCFVCVVEVEGQSDLKPSCTTLVSEGMVVRTDTDRVAEARRDCVELFLSDHFGDCLGPCMTACPAGIDIPGFVSHLAAGEDRKALELIKVNMPFPGILGRVCGRPCEDACRRQLVEEPVAICHLKRYAADQVSDSGHEYIPPREPLTGRKVGIVGAGPAGLTAAYYLQLLGHSCTVFEASEEPGGMLRYGIPRFRLPISVIDREVGVIEKLGAEIRCDARLGETVTLEDLRRDFDAVFLAVGASRALSLGVAGEGTTGVVSALDFLRAQSGSSPAKDLAGQKVIVIGGGDVAMDVARVALRKGASSVRVFSLEQRDEMPAREEETVGALAEGVGLENGWGLKEILAEGGKVSGLTLKRCTRVFDEQGRFNPGYDESDTRGESCQMVIGAIGQAVDTGAVSGVAKTRPGRLVVDEQTMQTSVPGLFAAGDCVTGPFNAVNAVAGGRKAAIAIDQVLMGREVVGEPAVFTDSMGELSAIPAAVTAAFDKTARVPMPSLQPQARVETFDEVETGFSGEQVRAEAKRCMECGCRAAHECRLRSYATLFEADDERYGTPSRAFELDETHPGLVYAVHKCIQCRTCIRITEELLGSPAMETVGRGFALRIRPIRDRLVLVDAGGLARMVEHCPVGALTLKGARVATLAPEFKRPGERDAR